MAVFESVVIGLIVLAVFSSVKVQWTFPGQHAHTRLLYYFFTRSAQRTSTQHEKPSRGDTKLKFVSSKQKTLWFHEEIRGNIKCRNKYWLGVESVDKATSIISMDIEVKAGNINIEVIHQDTSDRVRDAARLGASRITALNHKCSIVYMTHSTRKNRRRFKLNLSRLYLRIRNMGWKLYWYN